MILSMRIIPLVQEKYIKISLYPFVWVGAFCMVKYPWIDRVLTED